jgi:outer membrane protein OmpA-like peptidoglycan-associated protein
MEKKQVVKAHLTALSLLAAVGLSANSYASDQVGLQLELTPYFWAMGFDGKVTAGTQTAHFDTSFSDVSDHMDSGGSLLAVASINRFVLYLNYDSVGLKSDPFFVSATDSVRGNLDMDISTAAVGYRFDTFGDKSWIDVMVGEQMLQKDAKISRSGLLPASVQDSEDIDDTVILLRPSFRFAEKWRFNPTFSYGVSGDSDTTYTLSPQIQWDFSKSFALRFGFKKINIDRKDGVNGTAGYRETNVDASGPFLGLGWTFPSREKPVPVAAPAPAPKPAAPPVAAKCPDGDKDGVCDAADQCPNTPAGARVGPQGCDCDYVLRTHFAFDSAELTADDKAELDKLIAVLMNPKLGFLAGTVTGYTDNVGKPDYNVELSKRRAQAVVDYAKSKGMHFGDRFEVIGKGEADPIADNKTEDGRAQNRRVTIRRTDCGPAK